MKILDIRRANLRLLQDTDFDGVQRRLAAQLRRTPAQISQWFAGYRTIREDTARDIERRAGKPAGWLDVDRGSGPSQGAAPLAVRESGASGYLTGAKPRSWPLSVISKGEWDALSDDERMELEAALLMALAEVKRRRRERADTSADQAQQRVGNG